MLSSCRPSRRTRETTEEDEGGKKRFGDGVLWFPKRITAKHLVSKTHRLPVFVPSRLGRRPLWKCSTSSTLLHGIRG